MGDEREQQKQKQASIRAARDWLDEADASLAKGSGLTGDLKVMLAKAELQRAEETEPETRLARWRRRGWRIAPLTAAAAFIGLAWFFTPAVAPPETAGLPSHPAEIVTPAPEHAETSSVEDAAADAPAEIVQERVIRPETHEEGATPAAAPSPPGTAPAPHRPSPHPRRRNSCSRREKPCGSLEKSI